MTDDQSAHAANTFRTIIAEAVAIALLQATDEGIQLVGIDRAELSKRALLKLQLDQMAKMAVTMAVDTIEKHAAMYTDWKINSLLQDGMQTMTLDGRLVEVEMVAGIDSARLRVKNILTGAGLDVSDGAFVVFVDTRAASSEALKRWQQLTNEDTRLMIIPLEVPRGQTVEQVVAATRQDAAEGFTQ